MYNNVSPSFSFYLSLFCWAHLWFFAVVLAVKRNNHTANRFLALFLFCFSFIHVQHVLLQVGWLSYMPFFDPLCGIILSALGPLFYFYTRALTAQPLVKKDIFHLLIVLPAVVHLLMLLFSKRGENLADYYYTGTSEAKRYTTINVLLLCGMLLCFTVYLLASINVINRYLKKINQTYAKAEELRLKWFRDIVIALLIFSFLLVPFTLYYANVSQSSLILGYFSTLIYFIIVLKSLNTSVLFNNSLVPDPQPKAVTERHKYQNSFQTSENIDRLGQQIEDFLAQNPLLYDEDLSLKQMADALNIPPYILSEAINRYFRKSFFELINTARIEKAKTELLSLEHVNITIEAVGYNCGFGSKAAFYRAFKKTTGLTPTAYLKEQE
ncbi:helix-turn-helix domain-containing protein [Pedobacter sp.]|uniref:helix-turn-helix domain-containing protein n=1 Tax=Pedobacter sp. TaxID=1411316 RepID=UPI00396C3C3C